MENIKACTEALIKAMLESEEYIRFCNLRDQVRKDPQLHEQITAFRSQVFQVQNSKDSLDMYAEQERLSREFEEFRKNPLVHDFLEAELHVCRILQKITAEIADKVDLDTEPLAERIGW
jgi:cell fate (sporulation/competence/biofilm development) regulator YlbF (YheA/YmcA/DUF963 family)